jgi:hypothetical protein
MTTSQNRSNPPNYLPPSSAELTESHPLYEMRSGICFRSTLSRLNPGEGSSRIHPLIRLSHPAIKPPVPRALPRSDK